MLGKLFSFWRRDGDAKPLALYHAGETEQAERAAGERLASVADDRGALLTQAFLLADRGRGRDAIAIAERVLAANERDAQAWLAIARAHSMAGRRKQAGEALQAAVMRDRGDPSILADLALLAMAEGQVDAAAHHLARARGSGKRLAVARRELAGILLQRGQRPAAEHQFEQAIAADPGDALAHANLGALRKELGKRAEAAIAFERALEVMPTLSEASYHLAMLRMDDQDWPAAAALLRTYVAQQPRDAEGQFWLGAALAEQGDVAGARAAYSIAAGGGHARALEALERLGG